MKTVIRIPEFTSIFILIAQGIKKSHELRKNLPLYHISIHVGVE